MSNFYYVRDLVSSTRKGITPKYTEESDVLVLNQKCIRNNSLDLSFAQYHNPEKKFSDDKKVRVGDILINSTGQGTAGRCVFVKSLPEGKTVITDSHILIVRVNDFYTAGCLEYSLFSIENLLQTFMDGSTGQGEFDKQRLFNVLTGLPSKEKRKETYQLLNSLDQKIELNNRINAKLEAMAKTLYDYWFVQFDFPDANGKPYLTSGGKMVYNPTLKREIPEGWSDGIASDLFLFNPPTSLQKGSKATYIDMDALPTKGFVTKKPQLKEFNGGVKFVKNDVAVARITPCLENGKTALLSRLNETEIGFGSTEFIILRGSALPLPALGSCLSRSDSFRQFAISNMTGTSGRKRIDSKVLETYSLPIPPENLLVVFENKLNPLFEKMTANAIENDELAACRDWLLPMLMNGQVTVEEAS